MRADLLIVLGIAAATLSSYVFTLAPSVIRSDSAEFQFVPFVLGIAHPPGYPLYTLVGKLFSTLPIGAVASRMNLLSALFASATVCLVYLNLRLMLGRSALARWSAILGSLALATGVHFWQAALVAGIRSTNTFFTALFLLTLLWFALKPTAARLYLIAAVAGLAISHHPQTIALLPAAGLYLLMTWDRDRLGPLHVLASLAIATVATLLPFLYLPLRSAMGAPFGPSDLASLDRLLAYASVSEWYGTILRPSHLQDPQRGALFWLFASLQFPLPLTGLAGLGVLVLIRKWKELVLLLLALVPNAFVSTYSDQSRPDYLLPSFVLIAVFVGVGAFGLATFIQKALTTALPLSLARQAGLGAALAIISLPVAYQWAGNWPRVDRRDDYYDYDQAARALAVVEPGAVILADWDKATPLWYLQLVEGKRPDVVVRQVTGPLGSPEHLVGLEERLQRGLVYLTNPHPSLFGRFRPWPAGPLVRLGPLKGGDSAITVPVRLQQQVADGVELVGYGVDKERLAAGDTLNLDVYLRPSRKVETIYAPYLVLSDGGGRHVFRCYTTDARRLSTDWMPEEIVVESLELTAPLMKGEVGLSFGLYSPAAGGCQGGQDAVGQVPITTVVVDGADQAFPKGSLADFDGRLLLLGAKLEVANRSIKAPWSLLVVQPGAKLRLWTTWLAPYRVNESYTLTLQLLDKSYKLAAQKDDIPFKGVYHTYRWPRDTEITEWRELDIPAGMSPGVYHVILGVYSSDSLRRLGLLDTSGNMDGDYFELGLLEVE